MSFFLFIYNLLTDSNDHCHQTPIQLPNPTDPTIMSHFPSPHPTVLHPPSVILPSLPSPLTSLHSSPRLCSCPFPVPPLTPSATHAYATIMLKPPMLPAYPLRAPLMSSLCPHLSSSTVHHRSPPPSSPSSPAIQSHHSLPPNPSSTTTIGLPPSYISSSTPLPSLASGNPTTTSHHDFSCPRHPSMTGHPTTPPPSHQHPPTDHCAMSCNHPCHRVTPHHHTDHVPSCHLLRASFPLCTIVTADSLLPTKPLHKF